MNELSNSNLRQFVIFKLGKEEYGIDIQRVTIIEKVMKITRVPKTPAHVKGVINLRGEIIPIMDLRKRFHLPDAEVTENTRIIIIKVEEVTLGVMVDEVLQTLQLSDEFIENTTNLGDNIYMDYIYGVGKVGERIITLLNPEKLIRI